nr:MAG TPA: hypothetical protein [Caudoviricetes sp.]
MKVESCISWDSVHKSKILAKNSCYFSRSYPRNIRFQCHRCDTITKHKY